MSQALYSGNSTSRHTLIKMIFGIVTVLSYIPLVAIASMDNFTIPSLPAGCACPGDTLNFTCTIADNLVVAIWSGSAFACPLSVNAITILRAQFETSFTARCGPLTVSGLSTDNSTGVMCYSSMLSADISTVINRQTVKCSRDDIATGVIGSPHTLSVAGAAPVSLRFTTIGKFTFTFSWIPTVNCSSVTSYHVNVNATDCGNCRYNPGTNTATCSGWRPNGQTCSLSVMSEVCGGMTGDPSESLELLLQEPPVPQNVSVKPRYSKATGVLLSLSASFPMVSPVQVTGLSPPVTYSVQFNNDTQVFPESNCGGGVCTGALTDFPAEDFDFAVVVSNGLGNGRASPSMRVLNNIYSVVSLTVQEIEGTLTFTLNLLEGFVGTTDMRVEYRTGGVVMNATNSSTASAGGSLSLTLTSLQVGPVYTYSLFITQSGVMTEIQGTFGLQCQPEELGSLTNCTTANFIGGVRIASGDVCYTGTTPGGGFFAQTFCDQGYKPESSQRRVCQSDGSWSGSIVPCVQQDVVLSTGVAVAIAICLSFLLTLVLGVSIGVLSVLGYQRCRRSGQSSQTETEMKTPTAVVYEEPAGIKPDPHTQGNVAYGHVQFT